MADTDHIFGGSIPDLYDRYLVPMLFAPFALDLSNRTAARAPERVLELAAGTGVVTRALATRLPAAAAIVATDLNQAMLDRAAAVGTSRPVEWRQADALHLPFADATFDVVVCQFGVMFFPDKPRAFAEARRVLKPGGAFVFSVWDRIAENDFADVVAAALDAAYPGNPPRFLARTPHGYYERATIERDLAGGGFSTQPRFETTTARSRAASPGLAATAFCHGTPLRAEIEGRAGYSLAEATDLVAAAMAKRFGPGEVSGQTQAHIVSVEA